MKKFTNTICLVVLLMVLLSCSTLRNKEINYYENVFQEVMEITQRHIDLWDVDLYGSILLVDPQTKHIYANEPDLFGVLGSDKTLYTGILPDDVPIANTAIEWSEKRWAMVMLPLPIDKYERLTLIVHELFHREQATLGFEANNPEDNSQLAKKEGRVYLRLEMEALKQSVLSLLSDDNSIQNDIETNQHLTNAFLFRKYRQSLYPEAEYNENLLELNEGVAEWTGLMISERDNKQLRLYFEKGISDFQNMPSFVRSFAYYTIPAYGYLLSQKDDSWNKNITNTTNLIEYFISAFAINIPNDLQNTVEEIIDLYNGLSIIHEESIREAENEALIAHYKNIFIESSPFELHFVDMNIVFDPRNLFPLEDFGTVYPTITVIDVWGTLTVENGALLSKLWDKISLSTPIEIQGTTVLGDGWILELTDEYIIEKDEISKKYHIYQL
ncbi:MAG: hypothetical protein FWG98_03580 [Candidatus Cloacimonetes bacterium]|nr:hypothetical protein [Candidatus Cloacimonadota bacterium]